MCTLSLVTRNDGYLLAMNRDESIARGAGLVQEFHQLGDTMALYPSDGTGGTWIAVNEYGIGLALLNWNDIIRNLPIACKARSRGQIIPALGKSSRMAELLAAFDVFDLAGVQPFRLVGVFPLEHVVGEWQWNSSQLKFHTRRWSSGHWFSSSLSDHQAETLRGAVCRSVENEPDAGSVRWLRRLHASHAGGPGPFSVCVHRDNVRTLSYSQITVTARALQLAHFLGSPCEMVPAHLIEVETPRRYENYAPIA